QRPRGPTTPRLPTPAPRAPGLRVPGPRRLPRLVLRVRAARHLRARLHVDARVRQHQRRDAPRPRAGRHHLRGDHVVRALREQAARPARHRDPRGDRGGCRRCIRHRGGEPLMRHLQAATTPPANPWLNIAIFGAFVAITIIIVFRASRNNRTASDYYAAGRSFTGGQNGAAIAGDYLSAASFLGIVGAIAVTGYDGFLYSIGFLGAGLPRS